MKEYMLGYFWWAASWWLVWNRDVDKEGWRHSLAFFTGQVVGLLVSVWWLWDLILLVID